ncbi:hypothetical protein [Qipengyuania sp. 483]
MKKNILLVASGSFMALHGASASAQQEPQHAGGTRPDVAQPSNDAEAPASREDNRGVDVLPRPEAVPENDYAADQIEPEDDLIEAHGAMDHSAPEDQQVEQPEKKSDPL